MILGHWVECQSAFSSLNTVQCLQIHDRLDMVLALAGISGGHILGDRGRIGSTGGWPLWEELSEMATEVTELLSKQDLFIM